MPVAVMCSNCGKSFEKKRNRIFENNYCSRQCMKEFRRGKSGGARAECGNCGKEIWMAPSRLQRAQDRDRKVYCSWDCKRQWYSGKNHHMYKGKYKNLPGYVVIRGDEVPEEYHSMLTESDHVLEHRLVMAQHLGRSLTDGEVVHHKNGVKDDNRIENLELHSRLAHNGITNIEHKGIAKLKRENKQLKAQVKELQERLEKLEAKT